MRQLKFDINKKIGKIKPLNAVNNGPCHKRHATDQFKSNLETYKQARIPYARNHDASFCGSYGSEHTVDISAIFPDFNADPYSPQSYDFACTDEYILVTLEANTETFFRLGQKIEHYIKKYNIYPPKDFKKWAIVCEHIIRHYNEGWANGYKLNIEYWEIWNEPDLDKPESSNKRTWAGTKEQFFDLYEITAKHLKNCFPELKIGGPALAGSLDWANDFLCEMQKRNVPIDFFSWHIYCTTTQKLTDKALKIRELLDKYSYTDTESILNEWNYVRGWREDFVYSIETIIGVKGAAFTMACMSVCQQLPVDMLMYYDARPCAFNGLFDFYTLRPLKGYYPFKWFGMLYDYETEISCQNTIEDIYTICGCDSNEKTVAIITYYTEEDEKTNKEFFVDFGKNSEYEVYLIDETHNGELISITNKPEITLTPNSFVMIKEL